jgi:hypothetical protein
MTNYFNHAYRKAFIGTKATQANNPGVANGVNNGLLITAGVHSGKLKNSAAPNALGAGVYGFFNKDTYLSVVAASAEVTTAKPLVLCGTAIPTKDKIGQFHGGYQESNKSKYINPRYINSFIKFVDAVPEQAVCHVGQTNWQTAFGFDNTTLTAGLTYPTDGTFTDLATTGGTGTGLTVDIVVIAGLVTSIVENQVGTGYTVADVITVADDAITGAPATAATIDVLTVGVQNCEFEFLCGETYNLQVTLWGNPVLRTLNHDSYRNLAAYTGCCPGDSIVPVAVDSTLVFINWANQIITSPYLKDFIRPIVYTEAGQPLFATGAEAVAAGWLITDTFANYVSTGHIDGAIGGMRVVGAYVDTQFGNCSWHTSDYYNKDVVKMQMQLVDTVGDPCTFTGLCVACECCGFGGEGFGETYLREVLQSEAYHQNNLSNDPRIAEITEGNDLRDSLVRTAFYTKYSIIHSVPRLDNDTSQLDSDQYELCIYVPAGVTATALETLMAAWLTAANNPVVLKTYSHTACVPTSVAP